MKWLILKNDKDDFEHYFLEKMQRNNVTTKCVYKKMSPFFYLCSVIWMKYFKFPFESIWYSDWKKKIKNYDCVIVFDRVLSWNVLNYIHKRNSKCRLIFWYWNTIDNKRNKLINDKYREFCEIWSFDSGDCQKYNLKHNIQFYFRQDLSDARPIKYDAIFVGNDKGRFNLLEDINRRLILYGYRTNIRIVRDKTSSENNNSSLYCESMISYTSLLDILSESSCIIDVPQMGQEGITMRVLESIFFEKKLITTDKSIYKYDFYQPDNIFIWEKDEEKELINFLSKPYKKNDELILDNNCFDKWLKNFGNRDM